MPGDCGWLGSLSTFFQQIIYQAAVTQLFRHFNGRDRLHLHSAVETIVPGFGNVLETVTIQKVSNDPCTMLLRLF